MYNNLIYSKFVVRNYVDRMGQTSFHQSRRLHARGRVWATWQGAAGDSEERTSRDA